jgi:hypothetical protein
LTRAIAATLLALTLGVALAADAAAAEATAVAGPPSIVPGKSARFVATGFRPGSDLQVVLVPADRAACCGIRVPASFHVSSAGGVVMRFSVPSYYKRCGAWTCSRVQWQPGQKVVVTVSGYLAQAKTTTVIARAKA